MKKQLKKISAMLLAFIVLFGTTGTFCNTEVRAATSVTLTGIELAQADENLQRYKVVFSDAISATSLASWISMTVDGTTITAADRGISAYNHGDNKLTVYINYSAIQAGATSSSQITEHMVTLEQGMEFGDNVLAADVNLKVVGDSVSIHVPQTEFDLTGILLVEVDADGLPRYKVVFADPIGAFTGVWIPMIVDGTTEVTASQQKVCAYNWGNDLLTMYIDYDAIQSGATSYSDITEHIITLEAGTEFGSNVLKEDVQLKVSESSIAIYTPGTGNEGTGNEGAGNGGAGSESETTYTDITLNALRPATKGGAGGPQDDEKRYMIIFDDTTDVGATWVTAYVDGAETGVENAACIMTYGGEVVLLLQYDKVQAGATKASDIKEHIITFKAGTILGNNYKLAKDLSIKVSGQNFSIQDGKQTETGGTQTESKYEKIALNKLRSEADGGAGAAQDAEKRWLIVFDESTDVGTTWVKGYVDGAAESVDGVACIMMSGGKVVMLLQYDKVQPGATSFSEIKEHTVVFKAGTVLGDKYELAHDVTIKVNGGNFELVKGVSAATGDFVNPWNIVMFTLAGTCMLVMAYAYTRRKEEHR